MSSVIIPDNAWPQIPVPSVVNVINPSQDLTPSAELVSVQVANGTSKIPTPSADRKPHSVTHSRNLAQTDISVWLPASFAAKAIAHVGHPSVNNTSITEDSRPETTRVSSPTTTFDGERTVAEVASILTNNSANETVYHDIGARFSMNTHC